MVGPSINLVELLNRGLTLSLSGQHAQALAQYERVLAIEPDHADALSNRGGALMDLHRYTEALASFDLALKIRPDFVATLNNRGRALTVLNRLDEAMCDLDSALKIAPDFLNALNNRGVVFEKMARYDEALANYDMALAVRPDFVNALCNRGIALMALKRLDAALESFDYALKIEPDCVDAHWNESICRLMRGEYAPGFRKYEWRWRNGGLGLPKRPFQQPLWIGNVSLRGKTILLHSEQGLGDLIQAFRYVPLVAAKGATVYLEVPKALVPLVASLAGVSRILVLGESLPLTDYHCPLLSLPLAFGTTLGTIPAPDRYLQIDRNVAAEWSAKLRHGGEKLIGVCWRGNPSHDKDRDRSIRFAEFAEILACPGVRFVSLHKDLTDEERRLADAMQLNHPGADFKNTAEMIGALDLVISVDTAWTHWAGAIGKPVWILLPFVSDWRWLLDRDDSPWYPTARLFRQSKIGDWPGVIRNVKFELARALAR